MANKRKYKSPVRKHLIIDQDDLEYIQDYAIIYGISDVDFINEAIKEKIKRIENLKENGTPVHY